MKNGSWIWLAVCWLTVACWTWREQRPEPGPVETPALLLHDVPPKGRVVEEQGERFWVDSSGSKLLLSSLDEDVNVVEMRNEFEQTRGLKLVQVGSKSALFRAGARKNDILLSVNSSPLDQSAKLEDAVHVLLQEPRWSAEISRNNRRQSLHWPPRR